VDGVKIRCVIAQKRRDARVVNKQLTELRLLQWCESFGLQKDGVLASFCYNDVSSGRAINGDATSIRRW